MAKTIDIKAEDDAATMWGGDAPYIFCPPKDFFTKKVWGRQHLKDFSLCYSQEFGRCDKRDLEGKHHLLRLILLPAVRFAEK